MPSLSLRANFAWTLAGSTVYGACQWALLMILSRTASAQTVGIFALGLAIASPVFMLANLNLRAVQVTDTRRQFRLADYFGLRLSTTAAATLAIAVLAVCSAGWSAAAVLIAAVGLAKAGEALSDTAYGLLQQYERMDWLARSQIAKSLLSAAALGAAMLWTGSALLGTLAGAAAWISILALYDRPRVNRFERMDWNGDWRRMSELARLAAPLGVVMLLVSLIGNIARYFLAGYCGPAELGLFSVMAYPAVAGTALLSALAQAAGPRLARSYGSGRIDFLRLASLLMGLAILLGLAGWLAAVVAGRPILQLLYGPSYARQTGAFAWMMVAGAVGYLASALGYIITAALAFRIQVPPAALTGLVTAAGCLFLVPPYGLTGAAWAQAAGSAVQVSGSLAVLWKRLVPKI